MSEGGEVRAGIEARVDVPDTALLTGELGEREEEEEKRDR